MGTIPKGPPPMSWFSVKYADYERVAQARAEEVAKWWADDARREAFGRAQGGGN
jgi:hypothetical protein